MVRSFSEIVFILQPLGSKEPDRLYRFPSVCTFVTVVCNPGGIGYNPAIIIMSFDIYY